MIHSYQKQKPKIASDIFIAEGAQVIGDVVIGKGSSVWFNTVIRGDVHYIRIGEQTNIQDNSVIHVTTATHPTLVGNQVTVGHRVILHGCTVEDGALIGMGSVVMDGAVVGSRSMVGAGSLVTPGTKIPPKVLALGTPCKVVRELKEGELQMLEASAQHYFELSKNYLKTVT